MGSDAVSWFDDPKCEHGVMLDKLCSACIITMGNENGHRPASKTPYNSSPQAGGNGPGTAVATYTPAPGASSVSVTVGAGGGGGGGGNYWTPLSQHSLQHSNPFTGGGNSAAYNYARQVQNFQAQNLTFGMAFIGGGGLVIEF